MYFEFVIGIVCSCFLNICNVDETNNTYEVLSSDPLKWKTCAAHNKYAI